MHKRAFDFLTDLHVAAVHMHASDHAALSGHICPVDHLLCIVEVQCHRIIQALKQRLALTGERSTNNKEFTLLCFSRASVSHLFYQSVVGSIQVEFSQVVPVSEDQVGLLFCT